MNTTHERLSALLTRNHPLSPEQLTLDAPLASLGIDSLGTVELLWSVEEAFQIRLPHDDPPALVTFGDVVRYVEALVAQQPESSATTPAPVAPTVSAPGSTPAPAVAP